MGLSTAELVAIHAAVSPRDELVSRRRAIYQAAVQLTSDDRTAPDLAPTVIDNPMLRGHLGDVLGGVADFNPSWARSLDELVTPAGRRSISELPMRIASSSAARAVLAPALCRIAGELNARGGHQLDTPALDASSPLFGPGVTTLVQGVRLASTIAPRLMTDLLPHVALLALLDPREAGPLGSASAREFPGLVVLPAPSTLMEAAEALVHEAAHQKLFDLAIVGSIFSERYHGAPPFTPPWAPPGSAPWPFEQTVAAGHAYACLAAFWAEAQGDRERSVHGGSLLPKAAVRASVILSWLVDRSPFLGNDGRMFIGRLARRQIRTEPNSRESADDRASGEDDAVPELVRQCGPWQLVMRMTRPVDIVWKPAREGAPVGTPTL